MCTPPTLRRSMALLYVYFFISMVVEGIRENVVREIILRAITFNVAVAVVVGPWVWQWCQTSVNVALKAKASTFEAKARTF